MRVRFSASRQLRLPAELAAKFRWCSTANTGKGMVDPSMLGRLRFEPLGKLVNVGRGRIGTLEPSRLNLAVRQKGNG